MPLPWLACAALVCVTSLRAQPLDAMLVLETSSGTEQAIGLIRPQAFEDTDQAGVIGFQRVAQVIQPLTDDHDDLAKALQRAGIRVGIGVSGVLVNPNPAVDIVGAVKNACAELKEGSSVGRKRAIILLFASEDPALSGSVDGLKQSLKAVEARLYVVAIQRPDRQERSRPGRSPYPFPIITAQILSRLASDSGGKMFRANWDLKAILAEARKP